MNEHEGADNWQKCRGWQANMKKVRAMRGF